jgi:hypothetical protein
MRLASMDGRALRLFQPESTGLGMTGPMRLVALLLMLWDEDTMRGRVEWDHTQIADRTGLSVAQVATALDQLRQIHLVKETAAGPKLTWEPFETVTLPQWRDQALMRPRPLTGSLQQPTKEPQDGNDQVEVRHEARPRGAQEGHHPGPPHSSPG